VAVIPFPLLFLIMCLMEKSLLGTKISILPKDLSYLTEANRSKPLPLGKKSL